MWLLLVLRQPAQVKLHLPGMLRAEFLQLEVHGHKPPQFAMIEQQVDIKVFIVHPDPLLPRNEGETIAEFEQEGFDLSQDRGFQLSLAVAVVKPEEIEDVRVAEDQIGNEAVFIAQRSEFLLCQFGRLSREARDAYRHRFNTPYSQPFSTVSHRLETFQTSSHTRKSRNRRRGSGFFVEYRYEKQMIKRRSHG